MQKKNYPIPKYSEKHGPSIGRLIIRDLPIKDAEKNDLLADIWSSLQQTIIDLYGLSVKGSFHYNEDSITCRFYLDDKYAKTHKIDQRLYQKRFKDTFSRQMLLFEEAIENFIFAN